MSATPGAMLPPPAGGDRFGSIGEAGRRIGQNRNGVRKVEHDEPLLAGGVGL